VRYLNVSCMLDKLADAGRRLGLRGHHIRWSPQTAQLHLFRNEPLSGQRLLILAPHPDDAEIAAFGLYADRDAFVVTVSAGNYADARLGRLFEQPADRNLASGRLRTWDSIVVPLWGGISPSRSVNLGYFNGSLEAMHSTPDAIVADEVLGSDDIGLFRRLNVSDLLQGRAPLSSWRSLVEDLRLLLRRCDPEIIVAPHPALDASPDHGFSTLALFEALDRVDVEPKRLLLYTNHHIGAEYFPFGPADGIVTLGPWFDETLPLRGVYSHPLEERLQLAKLFALDAMHDLRSPPRRRGSGPGAHILGRLSEVVQELWRDPTDTYSYYRRAARPNELFLTYTSNDREALVAHFERMQRPAEY
jgi:LmbE family N-acetylglucosaminyl deacetylase